jgi:hypothetical protein
MKGLVKVVDKLLVKGEGSGVEEEQPINPIARRSIVAEHYGIEDVNIKGIEEERDIEVSNGKEQVRLQAGWGKRIAKA